MINKPAPDLIRYWRHRIEQARPGLVVIDADTLSTLLDLAEKRKP